MQRLLGQRFLYVWILIVAACQQTACTANYTRHVWNESLASVNLADSHYHQRSAQWVIHPRTSVCLAPPINWDEGVRRRALLALHQSVEQSFLQAFPQLTTFAEITSQDQALHHARARGCELLVLSMLVDVQNHINTRHEIHIGAALQDDKSTRPDRVAVAIHIFEARTGRLLDVATLGSRQRLFARSDALPTDLFDEAIRKYVRSLTGQTTG